MTTWVAVMSVLAASQAATSGLEGAAAAGAATRAAAMAMADVRKLTMPNDTGDMAKAALTPRLVGVAVRPSFRRRVRRSRLGQPGRRRMVKVWWAAVAALALWPSMAGAQRLEDPEANIVEELVIQAKE